MTVSLLSIEVVAEVIPVATDITPVPAVAPVANAIVGCVVTLTPVNADAVVAVPNPVITDAPLPLPSKEPVAAVIAVPNVGTVLFCPEIINVSLSSEPPVPVLSEPNEKAHVEADPTAVTFGTLVVTNLLVAPGYDFTKVSVPSAPTAVPVAVALIFVVVGVTLVVNVALVPRAVSVVGDAYPVTAEAVPSAPTAVPVAVALILVVEGVTEIVG